MQRMQFDMKGIYVFTRCTGRNTTLYTLRMLLPQTSLLRSSKPLPWQNSSRMTFYSLGPVQPDTVEKVEVIVTDEERARHERMSNRPPLSEILNLHDFEVGHQNIDSNFRF